MITTKKTTDLKPGDIVIFADQLDTVVQVEYTLDTVCRVDVLRRNRPTFFLAGRDARHTVETTAIRSVFQ